MSRIVSVIILTLLLLGSISAIAAFTVEDLGPRVEVLETQVAELRNLHDLDNPTPEPTSTPEPTATPTSKPEACSVPSGASVWEPPSTHEHGDQPPVWADDWSCDQFGHPVIYGGDEATPNENAMKHEAYKGFRFTAHGWDVYLRYHAQSNPMGRMGQFHSYEIYALDLSGNVSFWQGWHDFGAVPERRYSFQQGDSFDSVFAQGIRNFVISSEAPSRHKQEYWFAQNGPDWWWSVRVGIHDATTWFVEGEHLNDPHNGAAWPVTGEKGLHRSSRVYWTAPADGGPRGWFCASAQGAVLVTDVSGPDGCVEGLPQYIAPTMTTMDTPEIGGGLLLVREYACPSCGLPN